MSIPEVSIITPVYNGYHYIGSTAESVLSQTFGNFEWLIIDDSSTDGTHEILQELKKRDSRISLFRHEHNRGPIHARNLALEASRGRFIAFLDIDDNWLPEKLEKHIAFMKETGTGLSYTSYRKFNNDGIVTSKKPVPVPSRITSASMKRTCSIMASSVLYDTDQTGRMLQDVTLPLKDDLYFWLRMLDKLGYGLGLKEDLARLRIHGDSLTGNKMTEAKRQWLFYRRTLKLPLVQTAWYFSHYAVHGTLKYLR